jgi:hypothetical protein
MPTDLEQTLQDDTSQDIEMSTNLSNMDKRIEIKEACDATDLIQLVRLANATGGLVDDSLRRRAWPILLGYGKSDRTSPNAEWRDLPRHRDEDQVGLDVNRAFGYYPKMDSDKALQALKGQLSDLIISVLRLHPALCYSQGYHDIAQVFLLVLGPNEACTALTYLSLLRVRDYMLPTLDPALKHLHLLPAIFQVADPILAGHLSRINPYFAVSAILTLNAHDITDYGDIVRTFDFLLAHEPVMSLYMVAAIVLLRREELLEIDDPDMLHFQLVKLPQPLDLQTYIDRALRLFEQHPPERLPGFVWWRLSSSSVLKTSRSLAKMQSLEEAETIFQLQVKQSEVERRRKQLQKKASLLLRKNKRPVMSISAALVVGCFAIWMRRTGTDQLMMNMLVSLAKSSWRG